MVVPKDGESEQDRVEVAVTLVPFSTLTHRCFFCVLTLLPLAGRAG